MYSKDKKTLIKCPGRKTGSITIPNSVTGIGARAFSHCSSLTSIDIPNSVTSIEDIAFSGCTSLTSINIPNSIPSIGGAAFNNCTSLTSINIPNSVTSIESRAFENCSSLTSINIPNSVTSIGTNAFYGCSSLMSIYSNIINPQNVQISFSSTVYNNATLYVPVGTLKKYQSAKGWRQFFTIVEDPSLGTGTSDVKQTSADNLTINVSNGQVSVSGVEDKTLVSVFDINGTPLGSTYSSNGNAVINTSLPQNAIVIIKVGNKSFKTIMK